MHIFAYDIFCRLLSHSSTSSQNESILKILVRGAALLIVMFYVILWLQFCNEATSDVIENHDVENGDDIACVFVCG